MNQFFETSVLMHRYWLPLGSNCSGKHIIVFSRGSPHHHVYLQMHLLTERVFTVMTEFSKRGRQNLSKERLTIRGAGNTWDRAKTTMRATLAAAVLGSRSVLLTPPPPPSSAGQYARQVGGLLASFGYKMWPTSSDGSQFHTSRHSMNTLGLGVSSDYWHSWILRCTAIGGIGEDAVLVRRRGLRSISSEIDFARFQTVFARFWAKLTIFSQQSTSLDFEQSWLKEKVSEVDLKGNRAKLT
jgi:hypothetical protein